MATVSSTLKMMDAMSGPLKSITTSMNLVISSFEQMQRVSERNTRVDQSLRTAKKQIASAEAEINKQIQLATKEQEKFNRSVKQGGTNTQSLFTALKGVAATYLTFRSAKAIASVSDEYVNTKARLDLINDGLQTTDELQNKIFASAERARGSYSDMAGVIGRMGILASEAFEDNDELIAFSELVQKSFRVGGAGTMEQQAGMYQLSQAMAAGRLQGDEFRSIMENAPMLAAAIAEYTGRSKGELKEMSAEGTITADVIKNAMFAAAEDINDKFATMPRTFSDIIAEIKNTALQQFGPAIEQISTMLNDPRMTENLKGVGNAIAAAAVVAVQFLSIIGEIYNFVSSNWTLIEPILWGIVAAVIAWRVAQWGLNIALSANPIGVVIMAIAALIGIIIAVVKWIFNLWETNDEFAAGFLRGWNRILNFFDQVPIFFTKIGHGIANALDTANVKSLEAMEALANGVIDTINWLTNTLNNTFGLNLKVIEHLDYAATEAAAAEARKRERSDIVASMEENAAKKAAEREQKVLDMLDDRARKRAEEQAEKEEKELEDFAIREYDPYDKVEIDKVGEVGRIRDTVDISNEDLKLMRELAEMNSIQNFVTLQPQLSFGDTHVRQDGRSVDEIVSNITERLNEELVASAQGVYQVG